MNEPILTRIMTQSHSATHDFIVPPHIFFCNFHILYLYTNLQGLPWHLQTQRCLYMFLQFSRFQSLFLLLYDLYLLCMTKSGTAGNVRDIVECFTCTNLHLLLVRHPVFPLRKPPFIYCHWFVGIVNQVTYSSLAKDWVYNINWAIQTFSTWNLLFIRNGARDVKTDSTCGRLYWWPQFLTLPCVHILCSALAFLWWVACSFLILGHITGFGQWYRP